MSPKLSIVSMSPPKLLKNVNVLPRPTNKNDPKISTIRQKNVLINSKKKKI